MPDKLSFTTTLNIPAYENTIIMHKYLDSFVQKLFNKCEIQYKLASFILCCIKQNEPDITNITEVYNKLKNCNKTTFYKVINKLKSADMIRKDGRFYKFDSAFSYNNMKLTNDFINFAGIKQQKNELMRSLLEVDE